MSLLLRRMCCQRPAGSFPTVAPPGMDPSITMYTPRKRKASSDNKNKKSVRVRLLQTLRRIKSLCPGTRTASSNQRRSSLRWLKRSKSETDGTAPLMESMESTGHDMYASLI